jgi:hypothetical protein
MSSGVTSNRTITAAEARSIGADFATALRSAGAGAFSAQRGAQELTSFITSNPGATPDQIASYASSLAMQRANTSRPNEVRVINSIVGYSASRAYYLDNPASAFFWQPLDIDRNADPQVARATNLMAESYNNAARRAFETEASLIGNNDRKNGGDKIAPR